MAIKSYNDIYLDDVSANLGTMFEYAVSFGYSPKDFWNMFVSSNIAKEIENGNPKYLAGHSAIDLVNFVIENEEFLMPEPFFDRTEFYWAGWALAHYQNQKAISFYDINESFPVDKILRLYNTLHEADITKFINVLDECMFKSKKETNLKKIRKAAQLSQSELAKKSEVSIRNIQMYEQRKNDINKAQGDIILKLSKTLGCKIEDLFE